MLLTWGLNYVGRITTKTKTTRNKEASIIILAAGFGSRIKSYEPRALLKVNNAETLIETQIRNTRPIFKDHEHIVVVGYDRHKVMKKLGPKNRYIENQLYDSTGSFESLRLGVNASNRDNILVTHGDICFNNETFKKLDYSRSFLIQDTKGRFADQEVGLTVVRDKVTILSYGLPVKWAQIAYFTGKELEILKYICAKNQDARKSHLTFEVINDIIGRGGQFAVEENDDMVAFEIDTMRDLVRNTNEQNFNI